MSNQTITRAMSVKTPSAPKPSTTIDRIGSAMAAGAFNSITDQLMDEARQNPAVDLNATLRHVLTRRTMYVGTRAYETCLIAIPLMGDLGKPFESFRSVKHVLHEAEQMGITGIDDGLALLDMALPKTTLSGLSYEQLYNLSSGLFDRGVRNKLTKLLDVQNLSGHDCVNAAVVIGLLYWRSGNALPALLTNTTAQHQLGELVRRHMLFERITAQTPFTRISAVSAAPLYEAVRGMSQCLVRNCIAQVLSSLDQDIESATISVITGGRAAHHSAMEGVVGDYAIEIAFASKDAPANQAIILELNSLCDGNAVESIDALTLALAEQGIYKIDCQFYAHAASPVSSDEHEAPLYVTARIQ